MSDSPDTRDEALAIRPWLMSAEIDEIAPALVDALGELEDVTKDQTANTGAYSYRYVDLSAVTKAVRTVFKAHGLAVAQTSTWGGPTVEVATTIWHRSGQWAAPPPLRLPAGATAQQIGSALTYARRYSLMALAGLAGADDDDGAAASAGARHETPEAPEGDYAAAYAPEEPTRRPMSPGTIASFRERAKAEDVDAEGIATIVEQGTDGRTTEIEETYADELVKLRVAFDNYLVHRLTAQPAQPTPGVSQTPEPTNAST